MTANIAIDEKKLIEDFKELIRIPDLKASFFHKVEELKHTFEPQLRVHKNIAEALDPVKETQKKFSRGLAFELRREKGSWEVSIPGRTGEARDLPALIPQDVIKYMIDRELFPGEIHMKRFTSIPGPEYDLAFQWHDEDYITGTLRRRSGDKDAGIPGEAGGDADEKTENLKTLLSYLLNNDSLYDIVMGEFKSRWKPLFDGNCISNERSS